MCNLGGHLLINITGDLCDTLIYIGKESYRDHQSWLCPHKGSNLSIKP